MSAPVPPWRRGARPVDAGGALALDGRLADDGNTGSGRLAGAKTDEHALFTGPNAVGVTSLPGK
jgi:hypothetical protein